MTTAAITNWSFFSVELVDGLFRRALRMTGSEADAWDLVQDTLERGLRRWPEAPQPDSAVRWLCVVLRNRNLDRVRSWHWRAGLRADPDLIDKVLAPEPAELPLWRSVDSVRVQRALRRLPPDHRQILLMQSRDQLSLREIAAALRLPLATVGTRVHRARNKLRVLLQQEAPATYRCRPGGAGTRSARTKSGPATDAGRLSDHPIMLPAETVSLRTVR